MVSFNGETSHWKHFQLALVTRRYSNSRSLWQRSCSFRKRYRTVSLKIRRNKRVISTFSRAEWRDFEAVQTKRKTVEIRNVTNDSKEKLELKDRVTKMALGWGYLIVATATQFIYTGV